MLFFGFDKVFKTGIAFLAIASVFALCLVVTLECLSLRSLPTLEKKNGSVASLGPLEIPFDRLQQEITFPIPDIQREIALSCDQPRPDSLNEDPSVFLLRLKKTGKVKKVTLPARIDFRYDKGLTFSDHEGGFWAEMEPLGASCVLAHVFISDMDGKSREIGTFQAFAEEAQVRASQDFKEGSPLRVLSEAHLLGKDLFLSKYGGGAKIGRIEIGDSKEVYSVKEGDFLIWKEGKWEKIGSPLEAKEAFLARVGPFNEKMLNFEAWGLDEYSRLCISSVQPPPFKTKVEEILSSVRIRSEKQISCMLEKQCFVLKAGDFVLKADNRWKLLRKQEERDAYLKGEVEGELFVFDRIDQKGGQKVLQGSLFDQARSQMLPVEYIASSQKKGGKGKVK